MSTLVRRAATLFAFVIASVVNPVYLTGCMGSDDEDEEQAQRAHASLLEMLDDLNGAASVPFADGGVEYEILIELSPARREQASAAMRERARPRFTSVAHACGSRTFYQSASACDTRYLLAVEGSLTLRRLGDVAETIAADVSVRGQLGDGGDFELVVGEGGQLSLQREDADSFGVRRLVAELGDQSFSL